MRESIRTGVLAIVSVAFLALALLMLSGCRTNAENGALIGAAAGAVGGYMIGNEADKH